MGTGDMGMRSWAQETLGHRVGTGDTGTPIWAQGTLGHGWGGMELGWEEEEGWDWGRMAMREMVTGVFIAVRRGFW